MFDWLIHAVPSDSARPLFGSNVLGRMLEDLQFTCLDIGARGDVIRDLRPLAPSIDAIGFEPDQEECERLRQEAASSDHPWRSLRFLPVALGAASEARTLHLYRRRGCSSLLEANLDLARRFDRGAYFEVDGTVPLSTEPLSQAASSYQFEDAVYLKVDTQGTELEILKSGENMLRNRVVGIRTEVSFLAVYRRQPLWHEIDRYLRTLGFVPMGFLEMHSWRRGTGVKHPRLASGPIPYSRGQLVHGDILYFKDISAMPDQDERDVKQLLRAAYLALAYEYVDHAVSIFSRAAVSEYVRAQYGIDERDLVHEVGKASRHLARAHRRRRWRGRVDFLRGLLSGG